MPLSSKTSKTLNPHSHTSRAPWVLHRFCASSTSAWCSIKTVFVKTMAAKLFLSEKQTATDEVCKMLFGLQLSGLGHLFQLGRSCIQAAHTFLHGLLGIVFGLQSRKLGNRLIETALESEKSEIFAFKVPSISKCGSKFQGWFIIEKHNAETMPCSSWVTPLHTWSERVHKHSQTNLNWLKRMSTVSTVCHYREISKLIQPGHIGLTGLSSSSIGPPPTPGRPSATGAVQLTCWWSKNQLSGFGIVIISKDVSQPGVLNLP